VEALLLSIGSDMAAEFGDRSQLLAFLLALRLRRPFAIIGGIFLGTVATHILAAGVGVWLAAQIDPRLMAAAAAMIFVSVGLWTLSPAQLKPMRIITSGGALATVAVSYFCTELGGKTWLITAALASQGASFGAVLSGTVIGELVINAPLVLLGSGLANRLGGDGFELSWIYRGAAFFLVVTGIAGLVASYF
jgi:Ca2+/H+ antiporter, TMEM165/GDT1 family